MEKKAGEKLLVDLIFMFDPFTRVREGKLSVHPHVEIVTRC